jgi:hypothetical protein
MNLKRLRKSKGDSPGRSDKIYENFQLRLQLNRLGFELLK